MWTVEIEGTKYQVDDLQVAYGTKSVYTLCDPVRHSATGTLHRVVKVQHPLAPDRPFHAIESEAMNDDELDLERDAMGMMLGRNI